MASNADMEQSGKTPEEYVRLVWDETFIAPEYFSDVRNCNDKRKIAKIVQDFVQGMNCPTRKSVYMQRLVAFRDDASQFDVWLDVLQSSQMTTEHKHEAIATMFTRVLRGYMSVPHCTPEEAVDRLKIDPWENYVNQF